MPDLKWFQFELVGREEGQGALLGLYSVEAS